MCLPNDFLFFGSSHTPSLHALTEFGLRSFRRQLLASSTSPGGQNCLCQMKNQSSVVLVQFGKTWLHLGEINDTYASFGVGDRLRAKVLSPRISDSSSAPSLNQRLLSPASPLSQ